MELMTTFYLTLTNRDCKILMATNFQFPLRLSNNKRKSGDIRSAEPVKTRWGLQFPVEGHISPQYNPRLSVVEKIYNPVHDIWIKRELVEYAAKYIAGHQVK